MVMLPSTNNFLRLAILVLGVWSGVQTCNTMMETCKKVRDEANELRLAEERCTAMREYLECVRTDIEDCEDGRTDQYAHNMVTSFCNEAYICSERLQRCYKNFTIIIDELSNSDNKTRIEKCGIIVPPIMKCQESVMADCHGQTGILETVSVQQANLNATCSDTIPCLGKILYCQSGILDKKPVVADSKDEATGCFSRDTFDDCGAYRTALKCMRENLTSCQGQYDVENIIVTLVNSTEEVCNADLLCSRHIKKCMCHINSNPSKGPLAVLLNICTTYDPFSRCLDDMDAECRELPDINDQIKDLRTIYGIYFTLLCTKDHGLCPPAIQCLAGLPESSSSTGTTDVMPFDMDTLCIAEEPVFKCLKRTSAACEEKQEKITFPMLENSFLDLCEDMAPHVQNISRCADYKRCLAGFTGFKQVSSVDDGSSDGPVGFTNVLNMYSGITKSDFWCRYLNHGYKCVATNALNCSLGLEFASSSMLRLTEIDTLCNGPHPASTTKAPITNTKTTKKPKPSSEVKYKPDPEPSKPVDLVIKPSSSANPQFTVSRVWVLMAAAFTTMLATRLSVH